MLLAFSQWLAQDIRAFNVFSYITLRTMLAVIGHLVHHRPDDDPEIDCL